MMSNFTVELKKLTKGLKKRLAETIQPFDSDSPNEIAYDYAVDLDGVVLSNDGAIASLPGRTQKITSGITGVVRYQTTYSYNSGKRVRVIYADDGTTGTWYYIDPDTGIATSIGTVTGGGEVQAFQFEIGTSTTPSTVLIMLSSKNIPKKWDGTTYATLGGLPATYSGLTTTNLTNVSTLGMGNNPSLGCVYSNRPFLSGDITYPYRLYHGSLFNPESWSTTAVTLSMAGALDIGPGDGFGPITAIIPEKSLSGVERLLIFKERAVYALTGERPIGSTGSSPEYSVKLIIKKYGTCSRHSVRSQSGDIVFLDCERIMRSVQATITNAESNELTLSYDVQPGFDLIPTKSLKNVYVEDFTRQQQLWVSHYKDYSEHPNATSVRALYHLPDMLDSSSNAYTLTNNAAATTFLGYNNYLDDSFKFNGTTQYLSRTAGIGAALTAFTASVWVKIDTLPTAGNKSYILWCDHTAGKFAIYVENVTGTYTVKTSVYDSSNTEQKASYTVTPTLTSWINIVLRWDGATITQFYNGVSVATQTCASIKSNGSNGFAIASASAAAFSSGIAGKIDEVFIYTTAQDEGDISDFYTYSTKNNNIVQIYDYRIGNWTKATDIINAASLGYLDSILLSGNYNATIDQQNSGSTFGLTRRITTVKFPWIESPNKNRFKVDDFQWWLTQFGTGDYIVNFNWDDGDSYDHLEAIVPPVGSSWDSATYDVSLWSGGADNPQIPFVAKPIGSGRRLQVVLYTYQENLPWIYLGGILRCTEYQSNN